MQGTAADRYDLFISYNWRDHRQVETVASALQNKGLRVFLDRWYLVPGRPWPQMLEEVLQSCRAVAIFLGSTGMGPWQQREKYLALERQNTDATPVIPVLLPGAEPALGFLRLNTWVDFRSGVDDAVALDTLDAAIRGHPPGEAGEKRVVALRGGVCPFRGLRVFREEDAPFFFGRDTYIAQLTEKVGQRSLVAVVGASGSGKSSVVRAGLVPATRRGAGGTVWEVATLLPGDRPLHALAAAMMPMLEPEMTETDRLAEIAKLATHFRDSTIGLRDVVGRVLEGQTGTDRLLLVVDQWEELYTLCKDEKDAQRFIDALLDATAAASMTVVLTVRGDFFGRVLSYRALEDRLRDGIVTLGPMNRDEILEVMVRPAEKAGLTFQPGLTARLLDDVGEEPGNLPLLEFVLTSLWDLRRGAELSHEAYDHIGEMEGALARRADQTYDKLNTVEQATVRQIFLQLVRPGAGSEDTRQRATINDIGAEARETLAELAEQRLLVTGRDESSGEETVEVAHEALIQHWSRLRQWLAEDRDFLIWRRRLLSALQEWRRTQHDPGTLLRGAPLAEAERWFDERQADLGPEERAFIGGSARSRNRKRRVYWVGSAATVVVSVAVAFWQYTEAERLRRERRPIIPVMVEVLPGTFTMGAAENDMRAERFETPLHEVSVSKTFMIGKYEVTFDEYDKFARATGRRPPSDQGWGAGRRPVTNVSWEDAVAYAVWLSAETGKRYRLPTEAEWEYAARARGPWPSHWETNSPQACAYANVFDRTAKQRFTYDWEPHACDDGEHATAVVGSFAPNELGLHDVLGNVWEWVQDCWHGDYRGAPVDGSAWIETEAEKCARRVVRGGSWKGEARPVCSQRRCMSYPEFRGFAIGFRLAQDIR